MQSSSCRGAFVVGVILLSLALALTAVAGPVGAEKARAVTDTFLRTRVSAVRSEQPSRAVMAVSQPTGDLRAIQAADGTVLAYVTALSPQGFVVTSADTNVSPIVAYSFCSAFPDSTDERHPLYRLLKEDMKLRLTAVQDDSSGATSNQVLWGRYASGDGDDSEAQEFQQWPAEDVTLTGGWLETTWHQDAPFNAFCPLDPVDGLRSYVGCVATAMAQVVHYHRQCNVTFDDWDGYSTYSGIDIDGDSARYDFPSFAELNTYLADVRLKYSRQIDLNDVDMAALSFACGVSMYMDYSSEGSGASPYDMQEALLYKFNFDSARMTGGLSTEFLPVLHENLANRQPVLLGMSPADGMGGHVVVCDGYNTDGEYHLNFGWGTLYPDEITDAWYHLPTELPSYLSAVQEILLDVSPVPAGVTVDPGTLSFYSNAGEESEPKIIFVRNNTGGALAIDSISCPKGFAIALSRGVYADRFDDLEIAQPGQEKAVYVKFRPEAAGSYYGILTMSYSNGKTRNTVLRGTSVAGGTQVEAGTVSGTWVADASPYYVLGDIGVQTDGELVIEPGVRVVFMGPYGFTVADDARLVAEGTPGHPIEFTAGSKKVGWKGLRFVDTDDDDVLRYCAITYGKKGAGLTTSYGPADDEVDRCGGAIYCSNSCPTLSHCKIANNLGDRAGAIYCVDSDPAINNTLIANNASTGDYPQSGGICCEGDSALQIDGCTIVNNAPGGVFSASYYWTEVSNSIVWGNSGYQIQSYESVAAVASSDIQDGYAGAGNIAVDPCFFDVSGGAGLDYDGLTANWALQSCSPCINAGTDSGWAETDLAGNTRVYSEQIDLGAYENQSDLPLLTLVPAGTVDAGAVQTGERETTTLELKNTGKVDFRIGGLSLSDPYDAFALGSEVADHLLTPGDSVEIEIGFAPTQEMIYAATLLVSSDSSNAPQKRVALEGVGVSGTLIAGGEVRGTWQKANSPYIVTGDIEVPRGQRLSIGSGVEIKFAGHYRLTVGYRATLTAVGTEQEPIVFTAMDTDDGWFGLRFVDSDDDDVLQYCTIEYASKTYSGGSDLVDLMGGGVLCCSGTDLWGTYAPSSPTIDHCLIADNRAAYGGGIVCTDDSEAVITHCRIVDNSTDTYGGGIWVYYAYPEISHCVIAHNSAYMGGGISNYLGSPLITNNTIVHNRPNGLELDYTMGWYWYSDPAPVINNILWENEMYVWEEVDSEEYDIRFNDIQGGWDGEGNIDFDPCFADSRNRDYHLKSEMGRWDSETADWAIDAISSPCIDAGNPASAVGDEAEPHGNLANMGAYGGTAQASKTP